MENYKYYLTFDVGIKNLAYCLGRYDKTKNISEGLDILEWGILDASYKPLICKNTVNLRKVCNKKSIYYLLKEGIEDNKINHNDSNNMIGYCQQHSTELKIKNKNAYKSLCRVSKNSLFENSFNVQVERIMKVLENFYNKKIMSIYDIKETGTETENYIINNLDVYIENQPAFKNPIMKTISTIILTYFSLKKIINSDKIRSVSFISPKEKTEMTFITNMKNLIKINPKIPVNFKDYTERKDFAIDATNQIIGKLNKSIFNIVSSVNYDLSIKKDDMADTLLYIISVIISKK
jgi:hypothetical protein